MHAREPPLQYQTLADKAQEEEEQKNGDEESKPQQQQTMQPKFPQFYGGAFVSGGAFVLGASTKDSSDSDSSDSDDSSDDEEKNYASGLNENDLLAVCGGRVRFSAINP
jgi:hypothetical protein